MANGRVPPKMPIWMIQLLTFAIVAERKSLSPSTQPTGIGNSSSRIVRYAVALWLFESSLIRMGMRGDRRQGSIKADSDRYHEFRCRRCLSEQRLSRFVFDSICGFNSLFGALRIDHLASLRQFDFDFIQIIVPFLFGCIGWTHLLEFRDQ